MNCAIGQCRTGGHEQGHVLRVRVELHSRHLEDEGWTRTGDEPAKDEDWNLPWDYEPYDGEESTGPGRSFKPRRVRKRGQR